jgi:uncharacterized membrane protein YuzA (DUF378 family)
MVILGLLLIILGALAILIGLFSVDGTAELLGSDLHGTTIFLIGVGAGVAVLWGWTLAKFGLKRGLQRRRESKQVKELSDKLERVEAERREEESGDTEGGTHRR